MQGTFRRLFIVMYVVTEVVTSNEYLAILQCQKLIEKDMKKKFQELRQKKKKRTIVNSSKAQILRLLTSNSKMH
jgi:hypothetical protein